MRLQELFEAQNYEEMFSFIDALEGHLTKTDTTRSPQEVMRKTLMRIKNRCAEEIEWAKDNLKRKDRVTWYLRWVKLWAINEIQESSVIDLTDEYTERLENQLKALRSKLPPLSNAQFRDVTAASLMSFNYKSFLVHILSLPAQSIKDFQFTNQMPFDLQKALQELEQKWIEENKGTAPKEGEIFLQIDKAFAWWDLQTPYSESEACAMGHCGNQPAAGDTDQTILSLRELLPNGKYRVCLTFILHKESGLLGEMKGRGNDKPAAHYHAAIVKLITDPRIKGIAGGGYAPGHNFSIFDLGKEEAKKLIAEKPALCPIGEYITHYGIDAKIKTELANIFQLHDDNTKLEGSHIRVLVAADIEELAADNKGNSDADWLFKYTIGGDYVENSGYAKLSATDVESNMDQKTIEKFVAEAGKVFPKDFKKYGVNHEEKLDISDARDILAWVEDNAEDAWSLIQDCAGDAENSATESAMQAYMKAYLNDDIDGYCMVTVNEGPDDNERKTVDLEEFRATLNWETWDAPVYALLDLGDFLTDLADQAPFFREVFSIEFTLKIKFEEPHYGFSATYDAIDAFEDAFSEAMMDRMGEIFEEVKKCIDELGE